MPNPSVMKTERMSVEFIHGVAFAAAYTAEYGGQPVIAAEIIHEAGITLEDLRRAKCDPHEMKPLTKLFRTEAVLRHA